MNVSSLHKLSKKFIVSSLTRATEKYITNHNEDFVLEFLTNTHTDQISMENDQFEEIISNRITDYINNDQFLSLPISSIQ